MDDQGLETGTYRFEEEQVQLEWDELCPPFQTSYNLLKEDTVACQDLGLLLDISSIPYDILWEDGSTNKVRNITNQGLYTYRIDHCSLEYSEQIKVILEDCSCDIQMPSIFSPNADNNNDVFKLETDCKYLETLRIKIFDRWGNQAYSHNGRDYSWDGKLEGKDLAIGVYVYQMEYKVLNNPQNQILRGTVTLVR